MNDHHHRSYRISGKILKMENDELIEVEEIPETEEELFLEPEEILEEE